MLCHWLQASEDLEDRESLAQIAASQNEQGTSDGETYIEKYIKGVSAVDSILALDRLRQVHNETYLRCLCGNEFFIKQAYLKARLKDLKQQSITHLFHVTLAGRPRITWLSTVQQDLKQHHLTLPEAADLARNCPLWRMMSTYGATQS